MNSKSDNATRNFPASQVVTRFAPSPTGPIHIGGIRTALYNWLYARKCGGRFLLRIEDTDRERSQLRHEQHILDSLAWLGLDWDEKPIRQSERGARYQQILQQLLESGNAYRCVCTPQRLTELREHQISHNIKPGYDRHCRTAKIKATDTRPFVVRLLVPTQGHVSIDDTIHARVQVDNAELDDMILARSDGTPTYQLSAVVDDIDSRITHVIRGDDHLNNTLRQAHLYRALELSPPVYTHLPLILDPQGKRYSKRTPGADLSLYRYCGIVPQALLNYLLRLGFSHGDQEYFTRAEMIELFSLDDLNRSAGAFNPGKLDWLNRRHIQAEEVNQLRALALDCLAFRRNNAPPLGIDDVYKSTDNESKRESTVVNATIAETDAGQLSTQLSDAVLGIARGKAANLISLLNLAGPLLAKVEDASAEEVELYGSDEIRTHLEAACQRLSEVSQWQADDLSACLKALCKDRALKMGELARPLRFSLLGTVSRLGMSDILIALGKTQSLQRLRDYLEHNPSSPKA